MGSERRAIGWGVTGQLSSSVPAGGIVSESTLVALEGRSELEAEVCDPDTSLADAELSVPDWPVGEGVTDVKLEGGRGEDDATGGRDILLLAA